MEKKEIQKLIKPFLIVFFISFLIINWGRVSWIFNYKFLSRVISDFFEKKEKKEEFEFTEKENSLEIPKIEVSAPLIFVKNENEVYKNLDRGVVIFPNSVLPGEKMLRKLCPKKDLWQL